MIALLMMAAGPVIIAAEGPPCVTKVNGVLVADADLAKTLNKLKARQRGVQIKIVGDVPYKCIGGTVYNLQRLKIRRLTFDPPLPR